MKCEICGKEFDKQLYMSEFKNICSSECFGEKFWQMIVEEGGHYNLNGESVLIKSYKENSDYRWLGCAGRVFYLQSIDNPNMVWKTNDLWIQGEIPDKYLDKFEKLKQITKEEYERISKVEVKENE